MADIISEVDIPSDILSKFDQAALPVVFAGLNSTARRVAPCLVGSGVDPDKLAEAKMVLLGALTRWSQTGAGAFQQQTAGPFSVTTDTRQRAGYRLWPSEIKDLQAICRDAGSSTAFSIDTTPLIVPPVI